MNQKPWREYHDQTQGILWGTKWLEAPKPSPLHEEANKVPEFIQNLKNKETALFEEFKKSSGDLPKMKNLGEEIKKIKKEIYKFGYDSDKLVWELTPNPAPIKVSENTNTLKEDIPYSKKQESELLEPVSKPIVKSSQPLNGITVEKLWNKYDVTIADVNDNFDVNILNWGKSIKWTIEKRWQWDFIIRFESPQNIAWKEKVTWMSLSKAEANILNEKLSSIKSSREEMKKLNIEEEKQAEIKRVDIQRKRALDKLEQDGEIDFSWDLWDYSSDVYLRWDEDIIATLKDLWLEKKINSNTNSYKKIKELISDKLNDIETVKTSELKRKWDIDSAIQRAKKNGKPELLWIYPAEEWEIYVYIDWFGKRTEKRMY